MISLTDKFIRYVCNNWGMHSVDMFISKICPCSSLFFLLSYFCVSSFLVSVFLPFIYLFCLLSFSLSRTLWLFWFFLKITCNNHKIPWFLPTPHPHPQPQPLISILKEFTFLTHQFLNPILERHHLSFIPKTKSEKQPLGSPLMKPIQTRAMILHWPTELSWGLRNSALPSNRPVSLAGLRSGSANFLSDATFLSR